MASLMILLLFGGFLSSFHVLIVSSGISSCGNHAKVLKPDSSKTCGARKLYQGYCLVNCPVGYYSKDGKCSNCHSPCSSCNEKKCLSCQGSNYLSKAGLCVKTCPPKTSMKNSSSPRVRLAGNSSLEGVVEVYHNGSWGTICADGWDEMSAKVLCKELKLGNVIEAKIVGQHRFDRADGYKSMKIWLSKVSCTGRENSILECKNSGWGGNLCSHLEDVGVRCSGPDMTKTCESSCGDGYFSSNGKCLECPLDCKTCTALDKCLSCNEMRFLEGDSCVEHCKPGSFGSKETKKCEPCPQQCKTCKEIAHNLVCTSCPSNKHANFLNGDQCSSTCPQASFSKYLRLAGNFSNPYEGLLQIKYKGTWHTVCDDGFYLSTARVFCRELGYGQPIGYGGGRNGRGTGKIIAQNIGCLGNEESFLDCRQSDWFLPGCSHYEDVGLSCQPPPNGYVVHDQCIEKCPKGTFKNEDNVCELCNIKCATCSKNPENCLSCREPYFHDGTGCAVTCPDGRYPNSTVRHCLDCSNDCMTCSERADRCSSCRRPLLHNGTRCSSTCPDNMYRKEYSCVKDCGLRHYTSNKVCHACPLNCLVCTSASKCKACEYGFVLTKQGKCDSKCSANEYWTTIDPKTVGVNLPLRLSSVQGYRYKGRLEIKHQGQWGTICNDDWSDKNAKVACRQLMLGPPVQNLYLRYSSFKELNISRIWLDDVNCEGTEETLADCKHNDWGQMNCVHSEDVNIECSSPGISKCESKCPPAYFINGTVCVPCSLNCVSCIGTPNNCSTCKEGYYHTNDSTCRADCPIGFYNGTDRECKPCHSSCLSCEGPNEDQCTSCRRPKVFSAKKCVTKCPDNEYQPGINPYIELTRKVGRYEGVAMVSVNGRKGFICSRYLRIEDGHVVCKQLQMGKALKAYETSMYFSFSTPILVRHPLCMGNESSILNCKQRWQRYPYCSRRNILSVQCSGPDTSNHCVKECAIKKNYYVTDNNVCSVCSTSCLRCEKNATRCTACREGLVLTLENKCEQYCREGTFFDKATNKCEKCLGSCAACQKDKALCTLCPAGRYLYRQTCVDDCNIHLGKKRQGSEKLRLSRISSRLYAFPRKIVKIFSKDSEHWLPVCGINWNIQTAAIVCHQLGYGDPVQFFTVSSNVVNVPANTILLNCTGKEETVDACKKPIGSCLTRRIAGVRCNRSTPGKECVQECGNGFYFSQSKKECEPCSGNCTSCAGTADTCSSCVVDLALHGTKCLDKCPDGYFINLKTMSCERCSAKCATCFDGWTNDTCSSCNKPYFLRDTLCVETCYPDHNLEDLMNVEKSSGNVRFVNGSNSQEGFVQVKKSKEWGVICYSNHFVMNLVCQELGFQSAKSVIYSTLDDFITIPKWSVVCQGYEKSLADCSLRLSSYCMRQSFITCNNKPLNKRVCRKENDVPCTRTLCFTSTSCVNGDGRIIPKDHSYCRHCPSNYYGDGVVCRGIEKTPPSVQSTYQEQTMFVRRRYYLPCYARAGRTLISPDRNSWFKDGKRVRLGNDHFLEAVHYRDAGIYTCVLQNSAGSVNITFNITIIGRPIITRADNIDIVHGQSVMLNCEVFAHPPATISWRMNNITFDKNSTRHDGAVLMANGSLWIQKSISQDAGIYECSASNSYGITKQYVTLHIGEEISFKRKAGSQTVAEGGTAKFKCQPLHATENTSIKWRRKGKTLQTDRKYVVGDSSLTIKNVASKDCGEYYCVVKNGQSIITSIGTLTIKNELPCIHTPPQNLKVEVGMYAKFYCAATGDPNPTILWQNKKQPEANVFEIKSVNLSHVGVYTCTARSKDKEKHAYAFLTVGDQYPCPYIFKKPSNTEANFSQSATFYCDGVAVSLLNFMWHKGDSIIAQSKKYNLKNGNRTLVINDVSEDDIGEYKCVVTGVHGISSATARLTFQVLQPDSTVKPSTALYSQTLQPNSTESARVKASASKSRGSSSSSIAGIVVGVLICILVILIILYFVHRYRRHGATPVDVMKDVKLKTFSRFQSLTDHTVLKYDTSEYTDYHDEEDACDTSDTKPCVRD